MVGDVEMLVAGPRPISTLSDSQLFLQNISERANSSRSAQEDAVWFSHSQCGSVALINTSYISLCRPRRRAMNPTMPRPASRIA